LLGIRILARAAGQRLFASAQDDAPPAPLKRDVAAGIASVVSQKFACQLAAA
jgi:hypothetical protein